MPIHGRTGHSETGWTITRERYVPDEDGYYESLFSLSNGRIGARATVDFDAGGGMPGFFHADFYGPGLSVGSHLINGLNPAAWWLSVDGLALTPANAALVEFRQTLDMERAELALDLTMRDHEGRHTRLLRRLFLPAGDPDSICAETMVKCDHSAPVILFLGFDGRAGNGDMGGAIPHVRIHNLGPVRARVDGRGLAVSAKALGAGLHQTGHMRWDGGPALPMMAEKSRAFVPFAVSDGFLHVNTQTQLRVHAKNSPEATEPARNFAEMKSEHAAIWRDRWSGALELEGPAQDEAGLRYAQFQMLQCADRFSNSTNIAARGLSSEYHSGHFFFNTEFYVGPYFALTEPNVARAFLQFRADTLDAAKEFAASTGFAGARYPEEADREGRPAAAKLIRDPLAGTSKTEWSGAMVYHLSSDVIHFLAAWLEANGDSTRPPEIFLPLLASVAEYLAALMRFDPAVGGRGARNVMCFDEFHYGVDHHLATNMLSQWALRWIADAFEQILPPGAHCAAAPDVDANVLRRWREIAGDIYVPPAQDGIWPIFEGYFALPDQIRTDRPDHLPALSADDQQRADEMLPFSSRLAKQADVVFLMSILPTIASRKAQRDNLYFYEPRTVHGSSLSLTPHAEVAARLGDGALARRLTMQAARYNLDFLPRENYSNGVHYGAYAGALLAIIRGFLGFAGKGDTIAFEPRLPAEWRRVRVCLSWQGRKIEVVAGQSELALRLRESAAPLSVTCAGVTQVLAFADELRFAIAKPGLSCPADD
jgi:kojibiose phosphorylase